MVPAPAAPMTITLGIGIPSANSGLALIVFDTSPNSLIRLEDVMPAFLVMPAADEKTGPPLFPGKIRESTKNSCETGPEESVHAMIPAPV